MLLSGRHYCPGHCGCTLVGDKPARVELLSGYCNRCEAKVSFGRCLICPECGLCNHCGSAHAVRLKPQGIQL